MKNSFAFTGIIIAIFSLTGCSSEFEIQESDVPKDLLSAFKAKYPNAQDIEWEAEKEEGKFYYEAEWKEDGKEMEMHISPDGTITPED